jgi:hypothetical protein
MARETGSDRRNRQPQSRSASYLLSSTLFNSTDSTPMDMSRQKSPVTRPMFIPQEMCVSEELNRIVD